MQHMRRSYEQCHITEDEACKQNIHRRKYTQQHLCGDKGRTPYDYREYGRSMALDDSVVHRHILIHRGTSWKNQKAVPYTFPYPLDVPCPEIPRKYYGKAFGQPLNEAGYEVDEHSRHAYGGKRPISYRLPDYHGTCKSVEELEEIASDHRKREAKQYGKWISLSQID